MDFGNNRMKFADIVNGEYGRKVAYVNCEEISIENIIPAIAKCVTVMNENSQAIRYLWRYYKGDQPVHYRRKIVRDDILNNIVENRAFEIVAFKNGQTHEEPIQFVSLVDNEKTNKAVDELNSYNLAAYKRTRDIEAGEWQSAVGTSYKAVQFAIGGEIPYRYVVLDPANTIIGYSSITHEPLLAVLRLKDEDDKNYYQVYTKTHECKYKNGELYDVKLHAYGDIPVCEYPNNSARLSDIELVIDLLDAISLMASNRLDAEEQFVQSFMKFVNCEVDAESFAQMKKLGAIMVKSNNGENKADVDLMTQELNQEQSQVAKDDYWESALSILGIPNKQENTGGDTGSAVMLRNGHYMAHQRTLVKDAIIKEAEKKLSRVVLNAIRIVGGNDLGLEYKDYEANINHNPTDNLVVKTQALQYLKDCGVHPLIAIKTVGLWGDAEKVFNMSKPYIDNVWKKLEEGGVDIEEQTKKANLFVQFLNAGFSPNESAEKSGLSITDSETNFAKWNYEETE